MKMNIKRKIGLGYFTITLVITIVSVVSMQLAYTKLGDFVVYENLKNTAISTALALHVDVESQSLIQKSSDHNNDQLLIYDAEGNLLFGKGDEPFVDLTLKDNKKQVVHTGNQKVFIYDTKQYIDQDQIVWIRAYVYMDAYMSIDKSVYTAGVLVMPIIILGAFIGSLFMTKLIFDPINKISETAAHIAESGQIRERMPYEQGRHDELTELSKIFNEMFDRLSATLDAEKQFTADASHELRTPLAVMLSQIELLELTFADEPLDSEIASAIHTLREKCDYMTSLVNSLLMLTRMAYKKDQIVKSEVDASELLAVVVEELAEAAEAKHIKLTCDISDPCIIASNQMMLMRIFINILDNAIAYSKEKGHIRVKLSSSDRLNYQIMYQVDDDGIGIPEASLDKIWQRFYQVDQTRGQGSPRMGLGLYMVKAMVEGLEGEIEVESTHHVGSCFRIYL